MARSKKMDKPVTRHVTFLWKDQAARLLAAIGDRVREKQDPHDLLAKKLGKLLSSKDGAPQELRNSTTLIESALKPEKFNVVVYNLTNEQYAFLKDTDKNLQTGPAGPLGYPAFRKLTDGALQWNVTVMYADDAFALANNLTAKGAQNRSYEDIASQIRTPEHRASAAYSNFVVEPVLMRSTDTEGKLDMLALSLDPGEYSLVKGLNTNTFSGPDRRMGYPFFRRFDQEMYLAPLR